MGQLHTDTMPNGQHRTIAKLCGNDRKKIDAVRKQWARTFGTPFSKAHVPTSEEVAVLFPSAKQEASKPQVNEKAAIVKRSKIIEAVKRTWLLWLCLALSVGSSAPNMLWVIEQVKGAGGVAYAVTGALTIAPFLLIAYGVKGLSRWAVYAVIAVEIFCNTASFYGGLTGLSGSMFTAPTTFLHMVTSMTNSGYEGTALLLSISMAAAISALAIVPVNELGKKI